MTSVPFTPSVTYETLCEFPSRTVETLPLRRPVELTHRGKPIGTIRRPLERSEIPDGIEVVQVGDVRRGTDARAQQLRAGGSFAIGCFGRRIAVVEGISPPNAAP